MFRTISFFAVLLCCAITQFASGNVVVEVQADRAVEVTSCYEALRDTHRSGLYDIIVRSFSNYTFTVACDDETHYGGWTVIQRRFNGGLDFYRTWNEYKKGFGDLRGEFFIGLDKLSAMTSGSVKQELLIIMTNNRGVQKYAQYDGFSVANEQNNYILKDLGKMTGNTYDALIYHKGSKFSTKDRDVDKNNCSVKYNSAWWYKSCLERYLYKSRSSAERLVTKADLNAPFGKFNAVTWKNFDNTEEFATLTHTVMMIRPQLLYREKLN